MWHFYAGSALNIFIINTEGHYEVIKLGSNAEQGQHFQAVVRAGNWFASQPVAPDGDGIGEEVFSLVGCTVAPGFDFKDFEMARAEDLIMQYPQHRQMVERYCCAI